jgi:hypothetical protein
VLDLITRIVGGPFGHLGRLAVNLTEAARVSAGEFVGKPCNRTIDPHALGRRQVIAPRYQTIRFLLQLGYPVACGLPHGVSERGAHSLSPCLFDAQQP